jgi:hypothetical protein
MKTKLLSKLILVAVVIIITCVRVNVFAQGQPSNCQVCAEKDTYKIDPDSVLYLIRNFHNSFIKTGTFSNAGGYISFNPSVVKDSKKALSSYYTLKFHWGYIDTYKRLFITMEQKNPEWKCDNGIYKGNYGIESDYLFTSLRSNDVKPFGGASSNSIGTVEVLKGLLDKQVIIDDVESVIAKDIAVGHHSSFNTLFQHIYQCRDIVFNNAKTGAVIQGASVKNGFIYFFGYDPSQDFHKLRLIIAGLDENDKIVFFNADDFMFRENSRPRP